ncbi:MAG: S8 family serine peptidase [Candidatus Bathyarchaeota archaeon]|nr:S8 family serine peptidase [Candidatus Bathyarchaeota archaeon]
MLWISVRSLKFSVGMLLPILLLSVFSLVPTVSVQVALDASKISPVLWEEITRATGFVNVLIETSTNDYSSVIQQINEMGGKVGLQFNFVKGLSAKVPAWGVLELTKNSIVEKIYLEDQLSIPGLEGGETNPLFELTAADGEYETVAFTASEPPDGINNYWNTIYMGAQQIWGETNMGAGSLVAIIDTGIWTEHFMFAPKKALGEIVGGIDLSRNNKTIYDLYPPTWAWNPKYLGWDNPNNHMHGGHCAGTIASRGGVVASPGTRLYIYAQALEYYSGIPLPTDAQGRKTIWLLGMAPAASLYIVKVFDHTGGAIPRGIIILALEHVLNLKLNYGYDIDVVSMSLGGGSLFEGRTMYEQLIDTLTANGITVVAAAGNNGPASMTVATPGAAYTSITAGMAADRVHSAAYWDYYYLRPPQAPPGPGAQLFVSSTPIIDTISSRGPTSDGRVKPTLSATGRFVLSAFTTNSTTSIAWASGTSMATPAIAGATALLNAYSEMKNLGASPEDYKQALTGGAVWLPGFNKYEQGAGYLNATKALAVLKADPSYGDVAPPLPEKASLANIRNIPIYTEGVYTASVTNLPPGHKVEYVFEVTELTDSIKLEVTNVVLGNNPLGRNSLEIYIGTAKRTVTAYWVRGANVIGNSWFYITDDTVTWSVPYFTPEPTFTWATYPIEPGYVKVVIENDWTSYDVISANIKVTVTKAEWKSPNMLFFGILKEGQQTSWRTINVPKGTSKVVIELWWMHDWSIYPTSDLDLYIEWYNGTRWLTTTAGATWNSPERVVIPAPVQRIRLQISGYTIYTGSEAFKVYIYFIRQA